MGGLVSAIGSAANWVGNEAGQAAGAVGNFISDTQARAYGYPDAAAYNAAMAKDKNYQTDVATANQNAFSNTLYNNPAAAAAFNVAGGVGAHFGQTPLGSQNVEGQANNAIAAQSDATQNIPMPANNGGFTPAPGSPLSQGPSMGIQPSNSLGMTPIGIASPQTNPGASFPGTLDSSASSLPNPSTVAPTNTYVPGQNPVGSTINGVVQDHMSPPPPATVPSNTVDNSQPGYGSTFNGTNAAILGGSAVSALGGLGAAAITKQSTDEATKQQQKNLDQQRQDADPWLKAGTDAVNRLPGFIANHHDFGMNDFQQDSGYAFRLSEGMKQLQASAAAKGMLFSGNTLDAAQKYGQDMGSQEYQNAYNRYQTNYGTQLNALQQLSGTGQTAVGQVGQAGQNYANNVGQNIIGGGNALASGVLGVGNAVNNGIGTAINQGQNNALLSALQKQNFGPRPQGSN